MSQHIPEMVPYQEMIEVMLWMTDEEITEIRDLEYRVWDSKLETFIMLIREVIRNGY